MAVTRLASTEELQARVDSGGTFTAAEEADLGLALDGASQAIAQLSKPVTILADSSWAK